MIKNRIKIQGGKKEEPNINKGESLAAPGELIKLFSKQGIPKPATIPSKKVGGKEFPEKK